MDITLLGPQRRVAGARTAVADLIPEGPVAAINAGWRERESDTAELDAVLGGRMVNLELYRRWQQLTESDPPYADAERRLTANLEDLRGAYQLRLRHALAAVRAVSQRVGNDPVRVAARSDAVAGVRALDAWHIDRSAELRHAFYGEVGLGERPSVTDHRQSVARLLGDSAGLVVAGGHVGVLLHLLHVFGLAGVLRVDRPGGTTPPNPPGQARVPVIAWSAGAMALSPRVVLFGDHAPYGHPDPEVYAEGLGAYAHAIPFPHARRRLRLADSEHIDLVVARLAPYPALRLDDGVRLDLVDAEPLPGQATLLGAAS